MGKASKHFIIAITVSTFRIEKSEKEAKIHVFV